MRWITFKSRVTETAVLKSEGAWALIVGGGVGSEGDGMPGVQPENWRNLHPHSRLHPWKARDEWVSGGEWRWLRRGSTRGLWSSVHRVPPCVPSGSGAQVPRSVYLSHWCTCLTYLPSLSHFPTASLVLLEITFQIHYLRGSGPSP